MFIRQLAFERAECVSYEFPHASSQVSTYTVEVNSVYAEFIRGNTSIRISITSRH